MPKTRYIATISHHSIARARVVPVGDELRLAKRRATAEFGGDFIEFKIVIADTSQMSNGIGDYRIVASRRIGDSRWTMLD